jgi:hypothetical protein
MDDLWLVDPKKLEAKQDEATLLAIRDQQQSGGRVSFPPQRGR